MKAETNKNKRGDKKNVPLKVTGGRREEASHVVLALKSQQQGIGKRKDGETPGVVDGGVVRHSKHLLSLPVMSTSYQPIATLWARTSAELSAHTKNDLPPKKSLAPADASFVFCLPRCALLPHSCSFSVFVAAFSSLTVKSYV
jgi:hypothetical protein